jgi:hypothetical protein
MADLHDTKEQPRNRSNMTAVRRSRGLRSVSTNRRLWFLWLSFLCCFIGNNPFSITLQVLALPSGAGNCVGGHAAVGASHLSGNVKNDTLERGGITLTIGNTLLQVGTVARLPAQQDLRWNLTSTKRPFRGFLIRAEDASVANAVDTTGALSQLDEHAQVAETVCVSAFNVGGVTHTNNNQKRSVTGIFRSDEPVDELQLDVTIVVKNRNGNSIYYYTGYLVSVVVEDNDSTANDNDTEEEEEESEAQFGFGFGLVVEPEDDIEANHLSQQQAQFNFSTPAKEDNQDGTPLIFTGSCTDEVPCGICEGVGCVVHDTVSYFDALHHLAV